MIKQSLIISALRKLWWMYDLNRRQVVKDSKCGKRYKCANCKRLVQKIQVDHITPIGAFVDWNTYVCNLFCDVTNLQPLCKKCHAGKK